jgi:hypothetical protein
MAVEREGAADVPKALANCVESDVLRFAFDRQS